jgi:hypothetical protein
LLVGQHAGKQPQQAGTQYPKQPQRLAQDNAPLQGQLVVQQLLALEQQGLTVHGQTARRSQFRQPLELVDALHAQRIQLVHATGTELPARDGLACSHQQQHGQQ